MAIIEGRNPVIEAIKNDRHIEKLLISNSSKEGFYKEDNSYGKGKEDSYSVC